MRRPEKNEEELSTFPDGFLSEDLFPKAAGSELRHRGSHSTSAFSGGASPTGNFTSSGLLSFNLSASIYVPTRLRAHVPTYLHDFLLVYQITLTLYLVPGIVHEHEYEDLCSSTRLHPTVSVSILPSRRRYNLPPYRDRRRNETCGALSRLLFSAMWQRQR